MKIERRRFITGMAAAAGAIATRSLGAQSAPSFMYVGSFSAQAGQGRGRGQGITVYRRVGSAPWTEAQVVKDLDNPSLLTLDPQGRCLYTVHSDGDQVSAYRLDGASGQLTLIGHQITGALNGVHLSIDRTGRFLIVANHGLNGTPAVPSQATGSVSVLPINQDGSLAAPTDVVRFSGPNSGRSTNPQQQASHPHDCPFDPSGKFIVVPDKGLDKIFVFRLDTGTGKLVPANPPFVITRVGAGPRHVDFHPTLPLAYVCNEQDSTVTTYQFDTTTGALKPLQILVSTSPDFTGNNTPAEIATARSGRFVYVSNRGHNSISIFGVDPRSGLLSSIGWEPTQGSTPRFFALNPAGTELYAANQATDTVVIFRVSETTGKLTPTGEILKVGAPCTIAFR